MDVKKMKTQELKKWATSLYTSIYIDGCYGTRDMRHLDIVLNELASRDIRVTEGKTLEFRKGVEP
jgi:hypothetical protein